MFLSFEPFSFYFVSEDSLNLQQISALKYCKTRGSHGGAAEEWRGVSGEEKYSTEDTSHPRRLDSSRTVCFTGVKL